LRCPGVAIHLEFALEPVANDFQVQLAHARDDELAGFLVVETAERRIFLGEPLYPSDILSRSARVFGSTAMLMTGSGNVGGSRVTS